MRFNNNEIQIGYGQIIKNSLPCLVSHLSHNISGFTVAKTFPNDTCKQTIVFENLKIQFQRTNGLLSIVSYVELLVLVFSRNRPPNLADLNYSLDLNLPDLFPSPFFLVSCILSKGWTFQICLQFEVYHILPFTQSNMHKTMWDNNSMYFFI